MDNSAYNFGTTNQPPSIELDTIYEKVDLDEPEDAKRATLQDAKIATLKPTCKLSSAGIMTVAILALLLALLTFSLTSWNLTTESDSQSDSFSERGITCQNVQAPENGEVMMASNANSLTLGKGSVATYSCNTGFVLLGQTDRVCEDTNGGTVTTGTWSGSEPTCEEACLELPLPNNGRIMLTPGNHSLNLSLGTVATHSCNTGFVLVGQTTRVCEDTNGGTVTAGTWSGSAPTCEEILCSEIQTFGNGTASITPSSDSFKYSLGSVATYSCNTGFVLVGQKTRVCEDTNGGTVTTGTWSGSTPNCEEIRCPELLVPVGGTIMIGGGINFLQYSLGTVATYSCNTGSALAGQTTRVCEDTNGGTWSGQAPTCEVTCSALSDPGNGTVRIVPDSNTQRFRLRSTATYSCNTWFGLIGQTTRVCEETMEGTVTTGTWSESAPTCEATTVIDCHQTDCRLEQLTCPERSPCVINCEDSRRYACYQTAFTCSAGAGDCTVNCDDSYACFQADMTCPEGGNCLFNCDSRYSCQHTDIACSPGDGHCIVNCYNSYACRYANITCPKGGNCTVNCNGYQTGKGATFSCLGSENCTIDCTGLYACQYASFMCSENEKCAITCNDEYSCRYSNFRCPENANCTVNCNGQFGCQGATVTCPTGDYSCNIHCTDPLSCPNLRIVNTNNVNLHCCGDFSCGGVNVSPTSMVCPFID